MCIPRLLAVVVRRRQYLVPLLLDMSDEKLDTAVCTGL